MRRKEREGGREGRRGREGGESCERRERERRRERVDLPMTFVIIMIDTTTFVGRKTTVFSKHCAEMPKMMTGKNVMW